MASENTPYNYDTDDSAAQYSSPAAGQDGPGNTTASSGGGPGDAASQYSGGSAPSDSVDQTWGTQGDGNSAAQYSSPAVTTVNRSPRKGEPTE